jgi:predicted DNA-binding transcriptional regulator YafY
VSGANKLTAVEHYARAFDLVQRLQAGQRLSADRIAEICDCHKRTGYRIMQAMERSLPVRRIGGGYMGPAYLVLDRS